MPDQMYENGTVARFASYGRGGASTDVVDVDLLVTYSANFYKTNSMKDKDDLQKFLEMAHFDYSNGMVGPAGTSPSSASIRLLCTNARGDPYKLPFHTIMQSRYTYFWSPWYKFSDQIVLNATVFQYCSVGMTLYLVYICRVFV